LGPALLVIGSIITLVLHEKLKAYKSEKSIFSKDFKPVKRIIGQRLDYDDYFKSKIDSLH
jgi:hypothetical protein